MIIRPTVDTLGIPKEATKALPLFFLCQYKGDTYTPVEWESQQRPKCKKCKKKLKVNKWQG